MAGLPEGDGAQSFPSPRSFQVVKTLHNKLYESRGKMR